MASKQEAAASVPQTFLRLSGGYAPKPKDVAMTENLKYAILVGMDYISFILLLVLPFSAYLLGTAILQACSMESDSHYIGTDAVYIAGEACTVNMTLDRSQEEIATDMEMSRAS